MNALLDILFLVYFLPAIEAFSNECTLCCKPRPYIEISFNLQFIFNVNDTSSMEGVRLEYRYQETLGKWQAIQNYAPSPQQLQGSNIAPTAGQDLCAVPLNGTDLPISEFHRELVGTDNSSIVIRWVQYPDKRAVSWLIDNITMTYWDGVCVKTLLQQEFDTVPSQDDYLLHNFCHKEVSSNYALLFADFEDEIARRLRVNIFNLPPTEMDCETALLINASVCTHENGNVSVGFSVCPDGYILSESGNICQDESEKEVHCHNETSCSGEYTVMSMKQCCLETATGVFFTFPDSGTCHPCIVYGWLNDTYVGEEKFQEHILMTGFRKGAHGTSELVFDIISLERQGLEGAKNYYDFRLQTEKILLTQYVLITFLEDLVALEYNETFYLKLRPRNLPPSFSGVNVLFCDNLELTIVDTDYVNVYFTEDEFYGSEAEQSIRVGVGKSRRIATPLLLRIVPLSIDDIEPELQFNLTAQQTCPEKCSCECQVADYDNTQVLPMLPHDNPLAPNRATREVDFCMEKITVLFEADEFNLRPHHDITADINITNDNINEADQYFMLTLKLLKSEGNTENVLLKQRQFSLCRIVDDDPLRIGFSQPVYNTEEAEICTVVLLKEGDIRTEQNFSIDVMIREVKTNLPALQVENEYGNGDFFLERTENIMFPPDLSVLPVNITIIDDNLAEGPEAFLLHLRSPNRHGVPVPHFPINAYTDTIVIIEDNDDIAIGFEKMIYNTSERAGTLETCIKFFNSPLSKMTEQARYEILVAFESVNGTALSFLDYVAIPRTVIILNDHNDRKCFNVAILDNDYTENSKVFTVNITSYELLPSSANSRLSTEINLEPSFTDIVIANDDVTTLSFTVLPNHEIQESNSSIVIALTLAGANIEQEIVVSLSTEEASAKAYRDYSPILDKRLTFSSLGTINITINITDDALYEFREEFVISIKLLSEPSPSLILPNDTSIYISDDDEVSVSLLDEVVVNHQVVFLDEIGSTQMDGLVCDGRASTTCCHDYTTEDSNDMEPNGSGNWIYPDGSYVQRSCDGCDDVQKNFQLSRTSTTITLFQNQGYFKFMKGIYRCVVPLNVSDAENLTHYVGIYERNDTNNKVGLGDIEFDGDPLPFILSISTTGGPLANTSWFRNGDLITNNETFKIDTVVESYTDAKYSHTLTVFSDEPGTYVFSAINPFDATSTLSRSRVVEELVCDNCSIKCDEGYELIDKLCVDIDECESQDSNNCSAKVNSRCLNTNGSYLCQCANDYIEFPDGSCKISVIALSSIAGSIGFLLLVLATITVAASIYLHIKRKSLAAQYKLPESKPEDDGFMGRKTKKMFLLNSVGPNLPSDLFVMANNLELGEPIGQGEFGIVYRAHLMKDFNQRVTNTVAVKTLKGFHDEAHIKALLKECAKMIELQHPNVLTLIGVCLDGGPAPFIIMPFMANGSLLSHLRKSRKELLLPLDGPTQQEIEMTVMKLMDMCIQIAKGMEYLAGKKLVHRDLAARNCMIDVNYVIKVADFGLSVTLESKDYFRQDASDSIKLPVKWLAIESLNDSVFSEKSDVWAFGITCWEIFSGGKTPHATINPMNLLRLQEDGYRLEKPVNAACTDEMYSVMLKCWARLPTDRPTFGDLVEILSTSLASKAGYLDVTAFSGIQCDNQEVPDERLALQPLSVNTSPCQNLYIDKH